MQRRCRRRLIWTSLVALYWPGTLGLAATRDLDLISEFAQIAAEFPSIWHPYGYSPDIATDPSGEELMKHLASILKLVSDIIWRIVKGFQGDVLNEDSVTTTVRPFYPGGGARVDGTDRSLKRENAIVFRRLVTL